MAYVCVCVCVCLSFPLLGANAGLGLYYRPRHQRTQPPTHPHTHPQNSSEPLWKQSKRKAATDAEANPEPKEPAEPKAQLKHINAQIEAAKSGATDGNGVDAAAIKKALKKLYKMTMTPALLTTAKDLGLIANMKAAPPPTCPDLPNARLYGRALALARSFECNQAVQLALIRFGLLLPR